jgi:hypothetical protein
MRTLVLLQMKLATMQNSMFHQATLLRRRLRAQQKIAQLDSLMLSESLQGDMRAARRQIEMLRG